jgi:tRNA (cmo5U34)-methyltransferase
MKTSLGHFPSDPTWAFDAGVVEVFDDMIARSIPDYASMRLTVRNFASRHAMRGTTVFDLGASLGGAIEQLHYDHPTCQFVAIERAAAMVEKLRKRFAETENVTVAQLDLERWEPEQTIASVVLSVLTLQFMRPQARLRVMRAARDALKQGGVFILVEKVLAETWRMNGVLTAEYELRKEGAGYSRAEIDAKRRSLHGVLVPWTARKNEKALEEAGFRDVECVWRSLNFACWAAIK